MKHSPIIFSTPMVRAILEGRKTQTRRLVKGFALEMCRPDMFTPKYVARPENEMSPYGYAGDTLWVRETFAGHSDFDHDSPLKLVLIEFPGGKWYKADHTDGSLDGVRGRWRPSIHMPLDASRIALQIKDLRIERLRDISEADAISEGVSKIEPAETMLYRNYAFYKQEKLRMEAPMFYHTARESFKSLWETIHGPESWKENPFVWVIDFIVLPF